MNFRYDINGLRAIAVLGVLLFHFDNSWLTGGFAGVDVFFVISGYLMTSIIFRGFERNDFILYRFYLARANRIIPALAVLCSTVLILGWFFLNALDYKPIGAQVASSMTFLSNISYWMDSGYFNESSNENWLLHTWSLSVEWQFYIIYPAVLLMIRRFIPLNSMKWIILAVTFIALSFSIYASHRWTQASYFLLPTRAWEMLIGGVVFLFPLHLKKVQSQVMNILGLFLILLSYVYVNKYEPWPGILALVPVLGTCFVIYANQQSNVILNNKLINKLGRSSYSIYLWHWPVVVLGYYLQIDHWWVLGIPLSLVLGFFSYHVIESKSFIDTNRYSGFSFFRFNTICCAILFAAIFIFYTNGALFKATEEQKESVVASTAAMVDWAYPQPQLNIAGFDLRLVEGSSEKNILFIGASHIEQTYPYVKNFPSQYNVYFLTQGGCFITPAMKNPGWSCANIQNYKELFTHIRFDKVVTSLYGLIFPSSSSEDSIERRIGDFDQFLAFAKSNAAEVHLILGEPIGDNFHPKLAIRHQLPEFIPVDLIRDKYEVHYDALRKLNLNEVNVIDPLNYLCSDICPTKLNGKFAYRDRTHMRPFYAVEKLTYLRPILE